MCAGGDTGLVGAAGGGHLEGLHKFGELLLHLSPLGGQLQGVGVLGTQEGGAGVYKRVISGLRGHGSRGREESPVREDVQQHGRAVSPPVQ